MTGLDGQEPGTWLLDKIDAREQALTRQIEQPQAEIDTFTARLRELEEAAEHLRITRKTLLSLADEVEADAEPVTPPVMLPGHSAYRQILDIFAALGRPLRARDLCEALDLPIAPKNTEKIRAKLKRLVNQGILVEIEHGLFAQPRP
ncbi:hypothetical protein [Streptosporangium roseum]|uniref:hypothetical protein n=1 Tax=Streptosporangium roseum TaxID=2001 RepID=UPI0033199010